MKMEGTPAWNNVTSIELLRSTTEKKRGLEVFFFFFTFLNKYMKD